MANDTEKDSGILLPFTEAMQDAIVGHCLMDEKFFLKCRKYIKPEWFTKDTYMADIFDQLCKFHNTNGKFITSVDEFQSLNFFRECDYKDREKYDIVVKRCMAARLNFNQEYLRQRLTGFLRASLFKESMAEAQKKFNAKAENTFQWTAEKLQEIRDANFEEDVAVMSFKDPRNWLKQEAERATLSVSTGSKQLDEALGGGLFRGDTSAIMAPTNTGKTTFMITIVRHAIQQKKHVLFITHEGRPETIRNMILSSYMGISRRKLVEKWINDEKFAKVINMFAAEIDQYLVYVPYNKTGKMYIEDVIEVIKQRNEDLISEKKSYNKMMREKAKQTVPEGVVTPIPEDGFALIVDDYPKKLKSRTRGGKDSLYRAELAEIYDNFNQLAIELDAHCMVALQTNRDGLKKNNGLINAEAFLGLEEVDEAFGIAQNMGNIITLNRSPEDAKLEQLHLCIAKSRNDKKDIVVHTQTKYPCSLTHGDQGMFRKWPEGDVSDFVPNDYIQQHGLAAVVSQSNSITLVEDIYNALKAVQEKINGTNGTHIGVHSTGTSLT